MWQHKTDAGNEQFHDYATETLPIQIIRGIPEAKFFSACVEGLLRPSRAAVGGQKRLPGVARKYLQASSSNA